MFRIRSYYVLGLLALSILTSCRHSARMPNVIFVLTDDQGWGDIGYNGNQMLSTPTLDSLAASSVVIDRFYVSPVCAPSRASFLTGKYHLNTGVSWVTHRKEVMHESETTVAEIFKEEGYRTAYYGKWHNGAQYPHSPLGQGFDQFFGFCGGHCNSYFDTELQWNHEMIPTQGYVADLFTDSLINFIDDSEKPFYAVLAYNTPHTPYQVPDLYYDKYLQMGLDRKTAAIYGMIENIDHNVNRLLDALNKEDQMENTIFVYTSDNGPNFVRYNGGLKGRKAQVDEGSIRVPFIIHYPEGHFKTRHISEGFASHIDLLPTLLDLCGIQTNNEFHGSSFASFLQKNKKLSTEKVLFTHQLLNDDFAASSAVRTNEYLLTCYPGDTALFNLQNDPYQLKNIIGQQKNISDALIRAYKNWYEEAIGEGVDPEPITIDDHMDIDIDFPAHEADLSEGLDFAGTMGWANDWIINWDSGKDSISWDIQVESDCSYKVSLLYACKQKDIGSKLLLKTKSSQTPIRISQADEGILVDNPDRVIRKEVQERKWGVLEAGILRLSETDSTISISLLDDVSTSIEIKGIVLRSNEYKID